jgi:CheY-like chemotaxis protein
MKDKALEDIAGTLERKPDVVDTLMQRRVRTVLLVSSAYDSFIFQEDDRLGEALSSEYLDLHLRSAPHIVRVSTAEEALTTLRERSFDLVISMLRVGDMDVSEFGRAVREIAPELPVLLLAFNSGELSALADRGALDGIDRAFVWLGDVRLFLAMIKHVEDRWNVAQDIRLADVHCVLLVEDNIRFYSAYLPLLYTELVTQTLALMADGLNRMDRLLRQRARHKVLLATSYEEAEQTYLEFKDHIAGVITDARFPRGGELDPGAGISFARMVRRLTPDRPVVIQSSEAANEPAAHALGAGFIDKNSQSLLAGLQGFLRTQVGFGDFVFRLPGGREIARATDLRSMADHLVTVPVESLLYHGSRNDISTWLMARTEVELAKRIRPARVADFEDGEAIRDYLCQAFASHRVRSRAGVVAEFSSSTFEGSAGFVRIGTGSLGGTGRGLAFMHSLIDAYQLESRIPTVSLRVPPTAVVATGVFDEFIASGCLGELVLGKEAPSDEEITRRFLAAELPGEVVRSLGSFLSRVHYPLAVSSSSLLEDASYQPFAGGCRAVMIPNNHTDPAVRLAQLSRAIRLVYASVFHRTARAHHDSTSTRLEEEKMAVAIQQFTGRAHGRYFYPDIAGVARSYDYYPMEGMRSEDGVASVVLGLGGRAVEGGRCVRFSPSHPRWLYQFSSPEETLRSAQRSFLCLDLLSPDEGGGIPEGDIESLHLATLDLQAAERHGTLHALGSVFSSEDHAVHDGLSRPGVRLVTMAGVLKHGVMPLPESLAFLLRLCAAAFSSAVELEFAVNLSDDPGTSPHELAILRVRPVVASGHRDIRLALIPKDDAICLSTRVLGNGHFGDVRDVVYVPPRTFDRARTVEIAQEVGNLVGALRAAGRPVLLIGPGRWGSADRWLGIPVSWSQIAGVRCIVETDMADLRVQPSQGTHFFQNIASVGVGYFTVDFDGVGGHLDLDWLDAQDAAHESAHVRHLAFGEPLEIAVSGKRGHGAILKPGRTLAPLPDADRQG